MEHFFGRIGDVNPVDFKNDIQKIIQAQINVLKKNADEKQLIACDFIFLEEINEPDSTWRKIVKLPQEQLAPSNENSYRKFTRYELNLLHELYAEGMITLDSVLNTSKHHFNKIFLASIYTKGTSISIAEAIKNPPEELRFFNQIIPLIEAQLMTLEELQSLSLENKKFLAKLLYEEGVSVAKSRLFKKTSQVLNVHSIYEKFRSHLERSSNEVELEEQTIHLGDKFNFELHSLPDTLLYFILQNCNKNSIQSRCTLGRLFELIFEEVNSDEKENVIKAIIDYSNAQPQLAKNIEKIHALAQVELQNCQDERGKTHRSYLSSS